ncbi:MAG: metal ABC transporter permease [Acidimicrobiia bacterium]|nr:metal ABC transporter permease [Acidimicrobiia bacterium]MBT8192798.1 metal ABC transporter permease [Acidimicrobiia bacterium]MBT8248491.1 metal ABC transporter permease [Acidimicrobiia bacterium]NNF88004.1 metal ABC transporter permease [Acidimicrobiia bacterium]NNJ47172.1 metal ABC transporter permease [Acidimicrobiia bacterium]
MDWLTAPFELAFQQRALVGGSLAAIALALVGTWVVIRGMTFLGDALVHGVIPGIALAVLLDFNVMVGAGLAAAVMIVGINLVHRQTAFSEDTGIGLLFVGMLALGVILISRTASYSGSLTGILFGDALGVTGNDVGVLAGVAVITLVVSALFHRQFLVLSFNEQKAELLGLRPRLAHGVMLGLITLTIVGSFQTVGTLLVFGMLVGPPATAALLVRRVPAMMATAAAIGVLSVVAGLVISFHANTSGSATMALVPIVLFFLVLTGQSIRDRTRRSSTVPTA